MKTTLGQHTVLRQDLRINPRLYQAMDLLYMPLLDLQQHLKQELMVNPFLELLEPEEEEETPVTTVEKREASEQPETQGTNWDDILLAGFDEGDWRPGATEEREFPEPVSVQAPDLAAHLRDQLQLLDLSDRQRLLAEEFLGNIGGDGYLSATLEEIVTATNALQEEFAAEREKEPAQAPYTLAEAETLLKIMQELDPPGVAARDLRECLMLQLKDKDQAGSLAYRLLDEAYDDLIAHRWSDLAKRLGLDTGEVQAAADEIGRASCRERVSKQV